MNDMFPRFSVGPGRNRYVVLLTLLASIGLTAMAGCKKPMVEKDYARSLPPGAHALRKLAPAEWPTLTNAIRSSDVSLIAALDNSAAWFAKPSSKQFFPMEGVTHDQARASITAMRDILTTSTNMGQFNDRFRENFDIYTSIGWDGSGEVLYTGYYSPVVHASRTRTAEYRFPLYKRPGDLVSDPVTGAVKGRQLAGQIVTYPSRAQIEDANLLQGNELVWMKDKLDCYIVQIQGSAKLIMSDGTEMLIGYAGNNGHEYTSIGKLLIADGKLNRNTLSLPALRTYFLNNPQELDAYTHRNERFVFFKEYDQNTWPAGSLGVEVTAMRSLATDKTVFPRGLPTLVVTQIPGSTPGDTLATPGKNGATGARPFEQFMADQDTGGAILAPGRADIYMGSGGQAEHVAGMQLYEGRLYYLILKPQRVNAWVQPAPAAVPSSAAVPVQPLPDAGQMPAEGGTEEFK